MERIARVVERGVYILGPEVEAFEEEFADYLGVRHAVGVGNGTDAITIGLRALGVEPGDEVVVPSFTFYASAEAIVNAGARPVFCDVDPDTRNVTVETVRAVLTSRTAAILAVDLFGVPRRLAGACANSGCRCWRMPPRLRVPVSMAGAPGRWATPRRSRSIRPRTWPASATAERSRPTTIGWRSSPGRSVSTARATSGRSSTSATTRAWTSCRRPILRVVLPELDAWCDGRRAAARRYARGWDRTVRDPALEPAGAEAGWHLYVATHRRADELIAGLREQGVQSRAYYRTPLHRQTAMAPYAPSAGSLPVTDELARTNLALPMSPALGEERAREVVAALAAVVDAYRAARSDPALEQVLVGDAADHPRRHPHHDLPVADVAGDERAGGDERLLADRHAGDEHRAAADATGSTKHRAEQRLVLAGGGPSCCRWWSARRGRGTRRPRRSTRRSRTRPFGSARARRRGRRSRPRSRARPPSRRRPWLVPGPGPDRR